MMMSQMHQSNLFETIEKRLNMLFQPYTLGFRNSISLELCFGILKGNRMSDIVKVIKCWTNAWASSFRYHEVNLLPCLFGCKDCRDELNHYLQCPHLFALWRFLAGSASEDPLRCWGPQPCKDSFNFLLHF